MSENQKPKLVVLLSRFPFPLEKGDKLRAYYQIIEFSKTYDITLICISAKPVSEIEKNELEKYCKCIKIFVQPKWKSLWGSFLSLIGTKPLQVGYFYSAAIKRKIKSILSDVNPDHIFCQLIRATEYIKDHHDCPKTLDYMDAFSVGIERRIKLAPFYMKWLFKLEASRLKQYEREIYDYFEVHSIISNQDAQHLGTTINQKVLCVPNGVSSDFLNYTSKLPATFDLVFIGNLNYPPNVQAVKYITENILPLAKKQGMNWSLLVAGADPSKELIEILKNNPNQTLKKNIVDIREAYTAGKVFVAPMKIGTGLQNKLLEAMALGIPCITTELANNALNASEETEIRIANSPEEFATEINDVLDNYETQELGIQGKKFVQENFDWKRSTEDMINTMQKA